MKKILLAAIIGALAALSPGVATAADYDDDDYAAYDGAADESRVIVHERIIERHYIAPQRHRHVVVVRERYDDDDNDVVVVRPGPRHHFVADYDWPGPRIIHRYYGFPRARWHRGW